MQLMKFNGEAWEVFGDVITGEVGHHKMRHHSVVRGASPRPSLFRNIRFHEQRKLGK
jgi:hypothetical protein